MSGSGAAAGGADRSVDDERFGPIPAVPIASHAGAPLLQKAGAFWRLQLNRPSEHNRLDPADIVAMNALFASMPLIEPQRENRSDAGAPSSAEVPVRALVIVGAGQKTFSSGYTLDAIATELDDRFERMLDTLEALPCVTIAALNGSVYGGATDLALCCDLRVGVTGARMLMPAARFGLHYYPGGLRRYVTRLGLPAASKLMLTAMAIGTDEMLRIGFLSEAVEPAELTARVGEHLDAIELTEPTVVAGMKHHMRALAGGDTLAGQTALRASLKAAYERSLRSPELHRRLRALLSK